jgi:hypothetical protein
MTISQHHPQYADHLEDWILMRDTYTGERQVKSKGQIYLPATSGMNQDGMLSTQIGYKAYQAYKLRARFPGFVREAVQGAVGMMHSQPPEIKLPSRMENIRGVEGENLLQLLRKINEEQLLTGRIGLMLDLPSVPSPDSVPYIALYVAERIINWDNGRVQQPVPQSLNLVVLNETEHERTDTFTWESRSDTYRVLVLGDPDENESQATYRAGIFSDRDGQSFTEAGLTAPSFRGRTLNQIPFVFVNSADLVVAPDRPPLLDLANICVTIYRGEADYRQNLFMQGQDTLVVMGGDDDEKQLRVGAGARINVPIGGDAKYIGVQSNGLEEQRSALENLEGRAGTMGAQTLDSVSRERESGSSLRIRVAARTADMNQVALTGAQGLEDLLKLAASWMGLNPDEVSVKPNLEFGEQELSGQSMVEITTARNLGFPISARSMHRIAVDRKVTKMTFEEELKAAKKDEETPFAKAANGDRNPEQPPDDPENKKPVAES